jgi:hypothetical protein
VNIIETLQAGPLRIRLIEKLSSLDPDVFAPRYYLDVHHDECHHFGVMFVGHNIEAAKSAFQERARREESKVTL